MVRALLPDGYYFQGHLAVVLGDLRRSLPFLRNTSVAAVAREQQPPLCFLAGGFWRLDVLLLRRLRWLVWLPKPGSHHHWRS